MGVKAAVELGHVSEYDNHFHGLDFFYPALTGVLIPKVSPKLLETDDEQPGSRQGYRVVLTPTHMRDHEYYFQAAQYRADDVDKRDAIQRQQIKLSKAEIDLVTDLQNSHLRHLSDEKAKDGNAFERDRKAKKAFIDVREQKPDYSVDEHPFNDIAQQFGHAISSAYYEEKFAGDFLLKPIYLFSQETDLKNKDAVAPLLAKVKKQPPPPLVDRYLLLNDEINSLKKRWFAKSRFGDVIERLEKTRAQFIQYHQASDHYQLLNELLQYEQRIKKRRWYKFQFTDRNRKQQLREMIDVTKAATRGEVTHFQLLKRLDTIERAIPQKTSILKSITGQFRQSIQKRFRLCVNKAFATKVSDPQQYLSPFYGCQLDSLQDVELMFGQEHNGVSCASFLAQKQAFVADIKLDNPNARVYQSAFEPLLAPLMNDESELGQTVEGFRSEIRLLSHNEDLENVLERGLSHLGDGPHPFALAKSQLDRKMSFEFHDSKTPINRVADWLTFKLSGYLTSSLSAEERRDISTSLFQSAYPGVDFFNHEAFLALLDSELLDLIALNLEDGICKTGLINQLAYTCKTWFGLSTQSPIDAVDALERKLGNVLAANPTLRTKLNEHALKQMIAKGLIDELAQFQKRHPELWENRAPSPEQEALVNTIRREATGYDKTQLDRIIQLYLVDNDDAAPLREFPTLRYADIKEEIELPTAIAFTQKLAQMAKSDNSIQDISDYLAQNPRIFALLQAQKNILDQEKRKAGEGNSVSGPLLAFEGSLQRLREALKQSIEKQVLAAIQAKDFNTIQALLFDADAGIATVYDALFDAADIRTIVNRCVLQRLADPFEVKDYIELFYQPWRLQCASENAGFPDSRPNRYMQTRFHRNHRGQFKIMEAAINDLLKGKPESLLSMVNASTALASYAIFRPDQIQFVLEKIKLILSVNALIDSDALLQGLATTSPTTTFGHYLSVHHPYSYPESHIKSMLCSDVSELLRTPLNFFYREGLLHFVDALEALQSNLDTGKNPGIVDDFGRDKLQCFSRDFHALKQLDEVLTDFNRRDIDDAALATASENMAILKEDAAPSGMLFRRVEALWAKLKQCVNDIILSPLAIEEQQAALEKIAPMVANASSELPGQPLLVSLLKNPQSAIKFNRYHINLQSFISAAKQQNFHALKTDRFHDLFDDAKFRNFIHLLQRKNSSKIGAQIRAVADTLRERQPDSLWAKVMDAYAEAFIVCPHKINVTTIIDSYPVSETTSPEDFLSLFLLGSRDIILNALRQWQQALAQAASTEDDKRFNALLASVKTLSIEYFKALGINSAQLQEIARQSQSTTRMLTTKIYEMIQPDVARYDLARTISFLCHHQRSSRAPGSPVRRAYIAAPGESPEVHSRRDRESMERQPAKAKVTRKLFVDIINEIQFSNNTTLKLRAHLTQVSQWDEAATEIESQFHALASSKQHENADLQLSQGLKALVYQVADQYEQYLRRPEAQQKTYPAEFVKALKRLQDRLSLNTAALVDIAQQAFVELSQRLKLAADAIEINDELIDRLHLVLSYASDAQQAAMCARINAICYHYLKQGAQSRTHGGDVQIALLAKLLPYSTLDNLPKTKLRADTPVDEFVEVCKGAVASTKKSDALEIELWHVTQEAIEKAFDAISESLPKETYNLALQSLREASLHIDSSNIELFSSQLTSLGRSEEAESISALTQFIITTMNMLLWYKEHKATQPIKAETLMTIFSRMGESVWRCPAFYQNTLSQHIAGLRAEFGFFADLFNKPSDKSEFEHKRLFLLTQFTKLDALSSDDVERIAREADYLQAALADSAEQDAMAFKKDITAIISHWVEAYQRGDEKSYPVIEKMCTTASFTQVIYDNEVLKETLCEIIESHALSQGMLAMLDCTLEGQIISTRAFPKTFKLSHFILQSGALSQFTAKLAGIKKALSQHGAAPSLLVDYFESMYTLLRTANAPGIDAALPDFLNAIESYNHVIRFTQSVARHGRDPLEQLEFDDSLLKRLEPTEPASLLVSELQSSLTNILSTIQAQTQLDSTVHCFEKNKLILSTLVNAIGDERQVERFTQLKAKVLCAQIKKHCGKIAAHLSGEHGSDYKEAMRFMTELSKADFDCMNHHASAEIKAERDAAIAAAQQSLNEKLGSYMKGESDYPISDNRIMGMEIEAIQNSFRMMQGISPLPEGTIIKALSEHMLQTLQAALTTTESDPRSLLKNAFYILEDLNSDQHRLQLWAYLVSHLVSSPDIMETKRGVFLRKNPQRDTKIELIKLLTKTIPNFHHGKLDKNPAKAMVMEKFLQALLLNPVNPVMDDALQSQLARALAYVCSAIQSSEFPSDYKSMLIGPLTTYYAKPATDRTTAFDEYIDGIIQPRLGQVHATLIATP